MECLKRIKMKNGLDMKSSFPCGKCMPCLVTRKQEWTCRLILEQRLWPLTYFVTLTYSEMDLPESGDLEFQDLRDFWKRFRENTKSRFKYFAAGEYGDEKGRPHYHLLVFTDREFVIRTRKNKKGKDVICDSDFHKAWYSNSFVDVVPILGNKSARNIAGYIAGYCLKKLGESRDDGRVKEAIRSSHGMGEEYAEGS